MDEVANAFSRYDSLPPSIKRVETLDKYASFEEEHHDLIKRVSEHIREINMENDVRGSVKRHTALSRHSRVSSVSIRADAAAEAAVLKAKLQHLDVEERVRAELERKRAELERVTTVKELGMAEAKLDAISRIEQAESLNREAIQAPQLPSMSVEENVERFFRTQSVDEIKINENTNTNLIPVLENTTSSRLQSNVLAPKFVPNRVAQPVGSTSQQNPIPPSSNHQSAELIDIVHSLSEQVSIGRLPSSEPGMFSGDPLSYPAWKSSFQTLVGRKNIPSTEKLFYLKKYLSGAAKDTVEGYFLLSTEDAFAEAMQLLDQRYGNQFIVANAFRDKLELWPKVPSRDGFALRKLADFLRQCNTAMQTIPSLAFLNDERENRKLLTKLPDWLTLRWGRHAAGWRETRLVFPPFSEFVRFIVREANIACDPVTAISSAKPSKPVENEKFFKPERKRYTGASTFSTDAKETTSKDGQAKPVRCVLCDAEHELDVCKRFLQKTVVNRKEYAKEKGLCFGRLNDRGHRSKWCTSRKTCTVCSKRHPTSLHGDQRLESEPKGIREVQATTSSISHLNNSDSGSKSSMIVPVWICHSDNPDREILVYALLDTQSDTTFVLEDTCNRLGLDGPNVNLRLSTMCSRDQLIETRKITGLMVRAHDNSLRIALPPSYTRNIMPADRSHIPTPEMAERWPHLKGIASKLMPLADIQVGLLIGYNCSRALVPREVIPSVKDEPYAQKTDLGWGIVGIVGPIDSSVQDSIGVSHRILSDEVPQEVCAVDNEGNCLGTKTVAISFGSSVKEVISPREINRMMELDFSEMNSTGKAFSG